MRVHATKNKKHNKIQQKFFKHDLQFAPGLLVFKINIFFTIFLERIQQANFFFYNFFVTAVIGAMASF
jgi:hypothetical protein